ALCAEVLDDRRKILRRRGEVEQAVRADVPLLRNFVELLLQSRVVRGVVEAERVVADLLYELIDLWIGLVHVSKVEKALSHISGELVAERASRHSHDRKVFWQQPI